MSQQKLKTMNALLTTGKPRMESTREIKYRRKSSVTVGFLGLFLALNTPAYAEEHDISDPTAPITSLQKLMSLQTPESITPTATNQVLFKTPHVVEFFTKAGSKVLFVQSNELPMVDIRLTFDAGSARDSSIRTGLHGLASLTAQLLDEGTSIHTTDQIAANFERLGAQYSASSYRDMFNVDLRSLADKDKLNPSVTQLVELLSDAQFPQSSLDRIFQNASIGQQQREESPASIASIRFFKELYGSHPYAEPSTGNATSLKQITVTDIKAFKETYLVAKNLNISLVGQLSLKQAKALAEQISSNIPPGEKASVLPAPTPLTTSKQIDVPFDSTQTHIIIGQLGVTRDNPDLVTLELGNQVLGGGDFNALLMKELREKRGLTYGAYSNFSAMHATGPFSISYSTRNDQAAESIRVARQTLQDFLHHDIDPTLLQEAKEGMLNSFPLSLASNQAILGYLSMMGFYNLPVNYLQQYPNSILGATPQRVTAALNRIITPDKMVTVVVGKVDTTTNPSAPTENTSVATVK